MAPPPSTDEVVADALRQVESGRQQAARSLDILMGRYPAAEIEGADELAPRIHHTASETVNFGSGRHDVRA